MDKVNLLLSKHLTQPTRRRSKPALPGTVETAQTAFAGAAFVPGVFFVDGIPHAAVLVQTRNKLSNHLYLHHHREERGLSSL